MIGLLLLAAWSLAELESARDRQDFAGLERAAAELAAAAKAESAEAQYRVAQAYSYAAEVAQELRDRAGVERAARAGIQAAERAAALKPGVAEHHRILGTLCGQIVPVNVLAGISYARRAQDALAKALERDPKLAAAYLGRGVGSYYVPPALGGGPERAIADFEKAIQLNPKYADAWMWMGLAHRKQNRNAEARKDFQRSLDLNPRRVWARQQLEKTPAP